MPKKMVEGHSSKQAPANRTTYYQNIYFRRCGDTNGYLPLNSENIERVNTWVKCGNQVMVIARYEGYAMHRNTGISYKPSASGDYSDGITPNIRESVIYDLDRKHPITDDLLRKWYKRNNSQGLQVTF